ncbi:hypothetical protein NE237_027408 [Protea cynaroides]|uniref:Dynein light chain 1, cytoplasmic n=1 Tax=Protea cynaroides TaxID=273540 RepID=A0A9Q0GPA1_9MAGN|nr:hypothetical protein NE237_027408 [Protea cynaroides]
MLSCHALLVFLCFVPHLSCFLPLVKLNLLSPEILSLSRPYRSKQSITPKFQTFLLLTPLSLKRKMAGENGKVSRKKQGEGMVVYQSNRTLAARAPWPPEVKLAATAVELNVRPRSADMPADMQERAYRYSRALVDAATDKRPNLTHVALSLKKEFDASYGPAWHCVVGKSFGSFVTHSLGGFLYFSVDDFSFLLFKTEVLPVFRKTLYSAADGK